MIRFEKKAPHARQVILGLIRYPVFLTTEYAEYTEREHLF
jgi:hypothetical protein